METEQIEKRGSRAAYQARRRLLSVELYFPNEHWKRELQKAALDGGFPNFNAFLVDLIARARSGTVYAPEYVEALRASEVRARAAAEAARDERDDYRSQIRQLQQEVAGLQGQRDRLLAVILSLPSGAEAARSFLEQAPRGAV